MMMMTMIEGRFDDDISTKYPIVLQELNRHKDRETFKKRVTNW